MAITNKTNKQKCIDMWTWIVNHPGSDKTDWAVEHPALNREVVCHAYCFACAEVVEIGDKKGYKPNCDDCPVTWSDKESTCYEPNCSYDIWMDDPSKENAQAILDVIVNTWK